MNKLDPWKLIGRISVSEAAFLIAGVNPLQEDLGAEIAATANTFELAITEAVTTAHQHAWSLLCDVDEATGLPEFHDIWEASQDFASMIPTTELRANVESVFSDPANVPVLLQIDPWYSATLTGAEVNAWISRNSIESSYSFPTSQQVVVSELDYQADLEARRERNGWKASAGDMEASQAGPALDPSLQERPLGPRERTTLLNTVAALLQYSGAKETAIIDAMLTRHPGVPGLTKRTLEAKFAEAKRSLASR